MRCFAALPVRPAHLHSLALLGQQQSKTRGLVLSNAVGGITSCPFRYQATRPLTFTLCEVSGGHTFNVNTLKVMGQALQQS